MENTKSAININEATANTMSTDASTANNRRRTSNLNKDQSSPLLKLHKNLILDNHFKDVSLCCGNGDEEAEE